MDTAQIILSISVLLTALNIYLTYSNFQHNKKKDFQDKLYDLKIKAYQELHNSCYEATKRLDINSSPYVEIYDYNDENKWTEYCDKNLDEEIRKGFEMEKLIS